MDKNLKKIFEGKELSEGFKEKFNAVYKTQLEEDRKAIVAELGAKQEKILKEEKEKLIKETAAKADKYIETEVIPMIEKYVDYVAKDYVKENKLAIQSGIKTELAEKFLAGVSESVKGFNVAVPKSKASYVKKLEKNLAEANARIDRLVTKSNKLIEKSVNAKRQAAADKVLVGIAESQKEKIMTAAAKVKYISESQFTGALKDLKDSFYPAITKAIKESKRTDRNTQEKVTDGWLKTIMEQV